MEFYRDQNGKLEFPPDHIGKKTYVTVRGFDYSVPKPYTYMAGDGRYYYLGDDGPPASYAPNVMRDITPYQSPLDGKWVTSRSEHRDSMRRHGVIEMGNEKPRYRLPDVAMPRAGYDIKRALGKL